MNKLKNERLAGIIKKDVSDIIQFELKNSELGMVTVTEVTLNKDYSQAKIFVSFMGSKLSKPESIEALMRAKGFIRSSLAKQLDIRKCPDLLFVEDDSLEYGNHIDKLIDDLKHKAG